MNIRTLLHNLRGTLANRVSASLPRTDILAGARASFEQRQHEEAFLKEIQQIAVLIHR